MGVRGVQVHGMEDIQQDLDSGLPVWTADKEVLLPHLALQLVTTPAAFGQTRGTTTPSPGFKKNKGGGLCICIDVCIIRHKINIHRAYRPAHSQFERKIPLSNSTLCSARMLQSCYHRLMIAAPHQHASQHSLDRSVALTRIGLECSAINLCV